MRRRRLAAVALAAGLALLAASCLSWLTWTFQVVEEVDEYTIPGGGGGGLDDAHTIALDISQEEEFQSEEFDRVYSAVLMALTLTITASSEDPLVDSLEDGLPDDFAFVDSLSVYISADVDGVPRELLVAYIGPDDPRLVAGTTTVDLEVTEVDIADLVFAPGGYSVRIEATGIVPPDDVIFAGTVTYNVTVGLLE